MTEPVSTESQTTGFPGLRSWTAVYALVTIIATAYIILLAILSRSFQ